MGEFATYKGERIKIGTCENMYYLRADQREQISGYRFELPVDRFRFPFPDEDEIEPGHFDDYNRGVRIPGWGLPATLSGDEHGSVQFTSPVGYVLSIPCPEQFGQGLSTAVPVEIPGPRHGHPVGVMIEPALLPVHRNGFKGGPVVRQQAFRGGVLVTLVSCGACGCLHRLDTIDDAEPVIEAFRAEAGRQEYRRDLDGWGFANSETHRAFLLEMAARIMAGYFVRESVTTWLAD